MTNKERLKLIDKFERLSEPFNKLYQLQETLETESTEDLFRRLLKQKKHLSCSMLRDALTVKACNIFVYTTENCKDECGLPISFLLEKWWWPFNNTFILESQNYIDSIFSQLSKDTRSSLARDYCLNLDTTFESDTSALMFLYLETDKRVLEIFTQSFNKYSFLMDSDLRKEFTKSVDDLKFRFNKLRKAVGYCE
jgi:hypothetical protein